MRRSSHAQKNGFALPLAKHSILLKKTLNTANADFYMGESLCYRHT